MPVHVKCPTCGTILATPENFPGGVIGCPQCRGQLMVPPQMPAPAPSMLSAAPQNFPTASTGAMPPIPTAAGGTGSAANAMSGAPPLPPPHPTTSPGPNPQRTEKYPPGMTPPAPAQLPATTKKPTKEPAASVSRNLPQQLAAYPPGATPSLSALATPTANAAATMPVRQTQAARFITEDAAATRIDLGRDGTLPELQLAEIKEKDSEADSEKQSNPWMLIGVFGFSILASVAMLFMDVPTSGRSSLTKNQAREAIQEYYLLDRPPRKPYQEKLSQALIEHRRGDFAAERRYYRDVADMLHSEGKNPYKGITGKLSAEDPPNDRHLEEMISILLR